MRAGVRLLHPAVASSRKSSIISSPWEGGWRVCVNDFPPPSLSRWRMMVGGGGGRCAVVNCCCLAVPCRGRIKRSDVYTHLKPREQKGVIFGCSATRCNVFMVVFFCYARHEHFVTCARWGSGLFAQRTGWWFYCTERNEMFSGRACCFFPSPPDFSRRLLRHLCLCSCIASIVASLGW